MGLLCQSYQLQSTLSEIVSLVLLYSSMPQYLLLKTLCFFSHQELVAHCNSQSCLERAMRSNNQPLFPSPSESKRYYIRVDIDKQIGFGDSTNSDLSIEWNRNATPYDSVVSSISIILPIILCIDCPKTYPHVLYFSSKIPVSCYSSIFQLQYPHSVMFPIPSTT